MTKSSFLTNFERIGLKPLSHPESIELINRVSQPILHKVADYETLQKSYF
jgi:hypothetical protein